MKLIHSFVAVGTGAALLALTACSGSAEPATSTSSEVAPGYVAVSDPDAASGGPLSIQLDYDTDEAGGLDPQLASTARAWTIEGLVYETLTTVDENMAPAPGLAVSWSTPDDTTYVFDLDTTATFSNGRAMTTDDVVGSLERLLASGGVWASQLGDVTSVAATGEHEVTVKLGSPHTAFLAALANTPAAILPMSEVNDGSLDLSTTMLGTGPLMVTDHRQDEYWQFGINEHAADAAELGFESVRIDIVTEENTRVAALKNGDADLAVLSSVDSINALANTASVTTVTQQNTDYYYLMVNSRSASTGALADPDVRFAINTAIDRDQISTLAFDGNATATGVTPAGLQDSCTAADLPSAQADLDEAQSIVDAQGGLTLDLLVYTSDPTLATIAQVIQQNLAQIGVTVDIQQYDYGTYSEHVYSSDPADFDLALSWFAGYADPSMVTGWWDPERSGFSSVFMTGTDEIDSLIDQGASTPVGDDRAGVLEDLCSAVDVDSEMIPLVTRPTFIGYGDGVSPTITSTEGYGNLLSRIAEYRAQ